MKRILLWSVLVTAAFATDGSIYIAEAETKGPGLYHYDLAVLGTVLAIKFKAVLLVLAVIFGIGVYYKLFAGFGNYYKGLKCQPPVIYESPSHGKYNYDHEPYGNSERRDRANDFTKYTENLDFELLTTVMKGIGLRDLSFNIMDKGNGSCRRRIVCEADRLASTNPVVGYAIDLLRGLSRYRMSRPTKQGALNCAARYPECSNGRGSQRHLLNKPRRTPETNSRLRRE